MDKRKLSKDEMIYSWHNVNKFLVKWGAYVVIVILLFFFFMDIFGVGHYIADFFYRWEFFRDHFPSGPSGEKGLGGAIIMFFKHFWIEILSGIFLWKLLEAKLDNYTNMPRNTYERNHKEIAEGFSKSVKGIRILDNDINPFFVGNIKKRERSADVRKQKEQNVKKIKFKEKLESALNNMAPKEEIRILLLHPNSYAAKQRNQDIQNMDISYDMFEEMKEGIKRLHECIKELKQDNEEGRIKVRLFKATHSIIFAAWDDSIDFSIMPPGKTNNIETFGTSTNTPLAGYFLQHFKELWEHESTVDLEDYLYVKIKIDQGKQYQHLYWGPDSADQNLPIFLAWHGQKSIMFEETVSNPKATFQIIHDNEISWARLREINRKKDNSLYIFAKKQIENTEIVEVLDDDNNNSSDEEKDYLEIVDQGIYKIEYKHQHRINLKDGKYVNTRLTDRGYCFIPSILYDVYLGMRIRDMLSSLYDFYINYNKYYHELGAQLPPLKEIDGEMYVQPKRIVAEFICTVEKENITAEFVKKPKGRKADFYKQPNLALHPDQEKVSRIIDFLTSTIEADIDHILGKKAKVKLNNDGSINGMREKPVKYKVFVHLLQIEVDKDHRKADPQAEEIIANEADFTVIHMAGRKNITGGMNRIEIRCPELQINEAKYYNLTTPLDSIYLKNKSGENQNLTFLKVNASKVHYSEHEADASVERNSSKAQQNDVHKGFRNIVAIEFKLLDENKNTADGSAKLAEK